MPPFTQPPVIEEFEFLCDNERDDAVCKTLLEHDQTPDATVSVLEGVNGLELLVEVDYALKGLDWLSVVCEEQSFHPGMDFFRRTGGVASDLVGEFFVVANIEPWLPAVGCPGLQDPVEFFDETLRKSVLRPVNDQVYAAEMVRSLDNVVNIDAAIRDTYGVGFENVPGLLMGEPAALYMVGAVGEINLGTVVDASADFPFLFFPEPFKKRTNLSLALPWQGGISRDVPCLPGEESAFDFPGNAPVSDGPPGNTVLLGKLTDGNEVHTLSANFHKKRPRM